MASSTRQMVKEIILIVALNIFLPTLDVYSDLALIIKFLANRPKPHYAWATILIVPFILNYTFSWILWWRLDKNKWISWVAVILGCYPQWYAANVIRVLWSDFETGLAKKKKMDREVSEYEVFLESVFTVLGMTYIFVKADYSSDRKLVIGKRGSTEEVLFFLTYTTSILTASLGLAKCLKIGPCRVLGEGGALGGLCSGRFLLLMASVATTLVGKGGVLPWTTQFIDFKGPDDWKWRGRDDDNIVKGVVVVLCTMFLPGLLLALMSLCHYKKSFKTMLSHPSLLLMPVFTHFTFTTNNKLCTREEDGGHNDTRITFSRKWTLINVAVSVIGYVCFGVVINMMQGKCFSPDGINNCIFAYYLDNLIFCPLGTLSTLLFLFVDKCCLSCTPDIQNAVLRVNDPLTEYVVDNQTKQIITFDDWTKKRTNEYYMVYGITVYGESNGAFG